MNDPEREQIPQTFIGDVLVWDYLRDALAALGFVGKSADGSWTWTAEGHRWLVRLLAREVGIPVRHPF